MPTEDDWISAATPPDLPPGEVHVWRLDLDAGEHHRLAPLLSPDERERAARFLRDRDRNRYVAARGALRTLLGRYLGRDPAGLAFVYGADGKPALVDGATGFNVSHSDALGLLAFARGVDVGVDVERVRGLGEVDPVARRFFRPEEVAALGVVPEADRAAAFAAAWATKEAWVKARGLGIPTGLHECPVRIGPDGAVAAEGTLPIPVGPGHAAALAVVGTGPLRVRRFQRSGSRGVSRGTRIPGSS